MSENVYIGLGSNQGNREENMVRALTALRGIDAVTVTACSSLYDSAPMGPPQPRYLNAVVQLDCQLEPSRLLVIVKQIEADLGRDPKSARWAARPIDLDILLWDKDVVAEGNLQIPHLGLHQRRFVLEPLCELAPNAHHPMLNLPMNELLRRLKPQDVVRLPSAHWPELQPSSME